MTQRPIIRYHGAKFRMADKIIQYMPPHRIYTETFGGGAGVLLKKPRSYGELYNDTFGDVVNVFRVLRDPEKAEQLKRVCELTPFSRDEYMKPIDRSDEIEWARGVVFRSFAGFGSGSLNEKYNTGFRANSNRSGTIPAHDWASWPSNISSFTERLRGIVIENRPAMDVMKQHDGNDTLHYVDPPYVHETRSQTKKSVYHQEMTNEEHLQLLTFLKTLKGKVMLSGYYTDLYADNLAGWKRIDFAAMGDKASKRTECLWMNFETLTLF